MDEALPEGKLFATFEKHGEFVNALQSFLSLDLEVEPSPEEEKKELTLFHKLSNILDEYQEQSYLLDPFLEKLVAPVVECLKIHANSSTPGRGRHGSATRVGRVALLLYSYIKCRGYKTIIRFFPHEIADLSIALDYMLLPDGPAQETSQWALRYVVLLWLSLVCMIPFDLAQFDETDGVGKTATAIESVAKAFLGKAGLERESAAILLSRLYIRKDTRSRFYTFLDWSNTLLQGTVDVFTSIGVLQVLCEVVKSGPAEQIQVKIPQLFAIVSAIEGSSSLASNTIVRKFKTKLVSRVALRVFPAKSSLTRRKARILKDMDPIGHIPPDNDVEAPEDVEIVLEQLFQSLQDKDTIVRWSAAKGIARISERLPTYFSEQVLDTIMGLFAIHSVVAASIYDLPAIAESTWHGACLACAEMARRGLVVSEKLPELIEWLSKALYFDLRKGAHSIGSNVRDAAAYVLWALARAQDPSTLIPHGENLARRLATVALYDREIHIRRAASAAFQEHVGRTGLFPHGIDVLRKTDFYAVSIKRNAFLIAAPQVAEHLEYREFLFDHILNVTLRHWDVSMRQLGSQSLRLICQANLSVLGPQATLRAAHLLNSVDVTDLHGGLMALTEIAVAYRNSGPDNEQEAKMRDIFKHLARIPPEVLVRPRNELVTGSACLLIANTITLTEINLGQRSSVPNWKEVVDYGLKHRSTAAQESAAIAMAAVSKHVDCSSVVKSTLIRELKSGSPATQQGLGRFLGVIDYDAHSNCLSEALQCLLECVKPSSSVMKSNIEARRNCYLAMPQVLATIAPHLSKHIPPSVVNSLLDALQDGLEDYTIDERGDVGSWIRIACLRGLTSFTEILIFNSSTIPSFEQYFPASKYQITIGGILRQGVERLDNVRQEAGECFMRILRLPAPTVGNSQLWVVKERTLINQLFFSEEETLGWNDGGWLYPKAVRLLGIYEYRKSVLAGIVLSLGSKIDSTQRPLASSLVDYVRSLPVAMADNMGYNVLDLVKDLIDHATSHLTSNATVIPVLQTFNVLLEANALVRLNQNADGMGSLQVLLSIASKNVGRLKSIQRIHESMKIVVNLLSFDTLFEECVSRLADFLAHRFPSIRTDTAEYLYIVLQSIDTKRETDEVEEILLETEWSSADIEMAKKASRHLIQLFLNKE